MSATRLIVLAVWLLCGFETARATFSLAEAFRGDDFYHKWNWETFNDPTNGRVDYVDMKTAKKLNLTEVKDGAFLMSADDYSTVPTSARGRKSVRISSKGSWADSLIVLDLTHMPEGCATWPAFWTLSAAGPWPTGGEIDILEGVHLQEQNLASQHTRPGCTMSDHRQMKGTPTSNNCDTAVNYNQGCGVSFSKKNSYGAAFNKAGGGYYVMQRTKQNGVQVWFWSRSDPLLPLDIKAGSPVVVPTPLWGLPEASFPPDNCDYDQHFDAHRMVFDLTFCGDWAGAVWPMSGCGAGSCVDHVNGNPKAFSKAYWEVNSVNVYTPL
ncbi:hypothetical protein PUNSTDRAFT_98803 [Punctularia strigosozonata HHB-11173 SS5]|uniref:uncharacterized protein n=1 Tax=Punctularia strigosozonata (strain HHB-11173) TaxID=741275 RepID=UPI0004418329|nr:uncharacterized protein PUNSTDRAFT_98803 [Punctularia strigosozonata HHB-11173 SS5]EIN11633.1 hypothetical protein PUNSTDRAFT_98803 [Punctularia strigosozonata HHB-11173 SS5]